MKAIILVNMGAPESQNDMHRFLRHMFRDPLILPFNSVFRYILGEIISFFRYKKSWSKYELIGGSPLKETCTKIAYELSNLIGNDSIVRVAYSYSDPTISAEINKLISQNIYEIFILPMYPQASYSTTGSIERDISFARKRFPHVQISILPEYFTNNLFIDFWAQRISETMNRHSMQHPTIVFSAHSVPQYQITNGDSYEKTIYETARLVSEKLGLPYRLGFQSKIGKMKWLEPATEKVLDDLSQTNCNEVIIVPIAFLTENLETLYDIDTLLIPQYNNRFTIAKVSLMQCENAIAKIFLSVLNANIKQQTP